MNRSLQIVVTGSRDAAARRAAAALIRCMDFRDLAAADAILGRLRGSDLNAVTAWVWRIEAGRVYMASVAEWRAQHRADGGSVRLAA